MSYYKKSGRYYQYRKISYGREKALEHIRQAKALSEELGGTDNDVKKYFFSLSKSQLVNILSKYENLYGISACDYAKSTLPKWKSGVVHMSGMVVERLFKLLPPTMPLETKFQLTESLWKHVGPSSTKTYYFGLNVDLGELSQIVKEYLESVVIQYNIPNSMEARFNWLSQGDVGIKQKLLNYFRQQEKHLLSEGLRLQLPVLIDNLKSKNGEFTTHAKQILVIGKHEVKIIFNKQVNGISEISPVSTFENLDFSWIWWVIIGIIFIYWLYSK